MRALARMGHGAVLAIVEAHFPAARIARTYGNVLLTKGVVR